jgi:hypothetical protein
MAMTKGQLIAINWNTQQQLQHEVLVDPGLTLEKFRVFNGSNV